MKISTINTIHWVAIAVFWALLIVDLMTPGEEPLVLRLARSLSVHVFLCAQFYIMGTKRSTKKSTTYETSN